MKLTLEQQRAQDAWNTCKRVYQALGQKNFQLFVSDAKGLPALIMQSGLMSVLAFINQKAEKETKKKDNQDLRYQYLGAELRRWLNQRFQLVADEQPHFNDFMEALLNCPSQKYQRITAEAFAWLRWLRQTASAYSNRTEREE